MTISGRSAFLYAPGDAGANNKREPSFGFVPSSWTVAAVESAKSTAMVVTAVIALGTIWLLSRGKK